jgi:hypothetical protein
MDHLRRGGGRVAIGSLPAAHGAPKTVQFSFSFPVRDVVMAWLLLFDRCFRSFCTINLAMRLLRAGLEGVVVSIFQV